MKSIYPLAAWLWLIFSLIDLSVNAQEQLKISSFSQTTTVLVQHRSQADTQALSLPFFDDFAYGELTAHTGLWLHAEDVFINSKFGYLSPVSHVATLDALDRNGNSYSGTQLTFGATDSLVSQPILLANFNPSQNLALSFFMQQMGLGRSPTESDSLVVYFLDNQMNWRQQISFTGDNLEEREAFNQVYIPLDDPAFFHDAFQFKINSYQRSSGPFSHWNLTYFYLNQGRSPNNLAYLDRALASTPSSPLTKFTAIPYSHIKELDDLSPIIGNSSVLYYNLFSQVSGINYAGVAIDRANNQAIDTVLLAGNSNTIPNEHLTFEANAVDGQKFNDFIQIHEADSMASLEMLFFLRAIDTLLSQQIDGSRVYYPQYDLRKNDTVRAAYHFKDYYAYDDGSAEATVELLGEDLRLAIGFETYKTELLTAIDVYVPNIAKNQSATNIEVNIWESISNRNDGLVYSQGFPVPLADSVNGFVRLQLDEAVLVPNQFYIGYRQVGDNFLSLGFDKNTNSVDELFIFTGDDWQEVNSVEGSVMMRPVFDASRIIAASEKTPNPDLKIYPNPSQGTVYIEGAVERIEAFDINGQKVLINSVSIDYDKTQIDIRHSRKSLIFLRIFDGSNWSTHKILLK